MKEYDLTTLEGDQQISTAFELVRRKQYKKKDPFHAPSNDEPRNIYEIKLPKEGGILTYHTGHPHPYKGFPIAEAVNKVNIAKSLLMGCIRGFKAMFLAGRVKTLVMFLFFARQWEAPLAALMQAVWKPLRPYLLEKNRYCQAVREVQRVLALTMAGVEPDARRVMLKRVKDIILLILEYDDAYRFRFQHVIGQLDREAFAKDPIRELIHLVELGIACENSSRVIETWRMFKLMLRFVRFHPALKKKLVFFFTHLDIEEVKLSEEDWYYAKFKPDYRW